LLLTSTNDVAGLLPPDFSQLVVQPFLNNSVAAQVSTTVVTGAHEYRIPRVIEDPLARWTEEGAEIVPDDPVIDELAVRPKKLAALTILTRELCDDSSPQAADVVGEALARDCARRVDEALFKGLPAPAPAGLTTLDGVQEVTSDAAFENLDAFAEAISLAETVGAEVTSFVTSPATALALTKLRVATGSNQMLLGADATRAGERRVLGVPIVVSAAVAPDTVWAIPRSRVWLVLRDDTTVETDRSVFFTSDRVAVKCTLRAAFAVVQEAAVVRIGTA
jgi:HK97 family phage major capsid protein